MAELSDEHVRLRAAASDDDPWRLWGPYLAGRQWGTVREDYSADGDAWAFFPFDHAHTRAYRWGEDGIAGLTDRYGFLSVSLALWNGRDDRLKERYFGLTNPQGNHGEDVKEYWWALDATPTHSYARSLYRYPQAAYPYADLVEENARRSRLDPEYELADTGVLGDNRFFDVVTTHAKAAPDDVLIVLEATNQGPDPAPLDLVAQAVFRNTWAWGRDPRVPSLTLLGEDATTAAGTVALRAEHDWLGRYLLLAEGSPQVLVCDNETDVEATFGPGAGASRTAYPKNAIDRAIVHGDRTLLNPHGRGTKAGVWWHFDAVGPGETVRVRLRLVGDHQVTAPFGAGFDAVLDDRAREADEFYASVIPAATGAEDRHVARRAFAGLLWGKQLYRYAVREWLQGDPAGPPAPPQRTAPEPAGRNTSWGQFHLADVISMPDEWEYPWFATWDLAFHAVALARIDPAFAKNQLLLLVREWAQHPNGQLPAYEWSFSDVNPPVHAWAAWHVYVLDGRRDRDFLIQVFGKLLMNFSWWLNRKDVDGSNLFEGGFLGLDNISVFDRSRDVPAGSRLEQSDATSWVAFYALAMLRIALELSRTQRAFDNLATTFLEHFFSIAEAMETFGTDGANLWDEQDGFFYDVLVRETVPGSGAVSDPVRVRSLVGLLPLIAVAHLPDWVFEELPDVTARLRWLQARRPDLTDSLISTRGPSGLTRTLSPVTLERVEALLARIFDEGEFLGPYGIRSLSAAYRGGADVEVSGTTMHISYDPAESTTGLFGGNSNWRGPVWFPVNVLLADALRTYAAGAGQHVSVELPHGSGTQVPLAAAADEIDDRLISLFRAGPDGRRPGSPRDFGTGPLWDPHPAFCEYYDGDDGRGCGATHQTGWTALVAHLICLRNEGPGDGPS